MPASSIDIRGISVKLLKAHHLRYLDMRIIPDPLTGTKVIVLKFRRDKTHSPKAFFDDLNEHGIQYKKLSKDPDAQTIICELWPKGQKRQVSEAREKARAQQRAMENGGTVGPSNRNMHYVGVPNAGTQAVVIQSLAKDLRTSGHFEEARELMRIAGEQDWEEFDRRMHQVLMHLRLYSRPEVRQLREQVASEIVKALGPDISLLKNTKGSDLEAKINDCIFRHLDLVLDTRGIADSVLRRTASSTNPKALIPQMQRVRRGFKALCALAQDSGDAQVEAKAKEYVQRIASQIDKVLNGSTETLDMNDPAIALVHGRQIEAAYLHLVSES